MVDPSNLPPLSLYIHIPWCVRKCPYCDFNSHRTEKIPEQQYITALLEDLRTDLSLAGGRPLTSIFIGGGTPSLFSGEGIHRLLSGVGKLMAFSDSIEITLEANPGTAEADRFSSYFDSGVNRLSIGAQSFEDQQLQLLGRIHSGTEAVQAFELARRAGFDNINLDLMHGLPEQTPDLACADIQRAIDLGANHLSWYQLTLEPNTEFYKKPPQLPDEDRLDAIQQQGQMLLNANGYSQYEVSAYTVDNRPAGHNLNYWLFGDYLGIGAGAHSKITGMAQQGLEIRRYWKRRQPDMYLNCAGQFIAGSRSLQADDLIGEFMMNALRLNDGFKLFQFEQHTGLASGMIEAGLRRLEQQELIVITGDQIKTSALGQRFLDTVVAEFFPH